VKNLLLWFYMAIFSLAPLPCDADNTIQTRNLIEKATVTYQTDFVIDSSLDVWNKVLDHPFFMGKLWNLYNFQPAYGVTKALNGVKIVDPSGIYGEISLTDSSPSSRTFYGRGAIDHWAVPSFISAEGIFRFRYQEDGQRIKGQFEVYLRGDTKVADSLIKLFSGTLKNHLHSRFTKNLEDVKKIIFDLLHHPDQIRKKLTGESLRDFKNLLTDKL